jgi:hypothetical protein
MEERSFFESFMAYFPGALRTAIEETLEAQTPFTIERNKAVFNKRAAEIEELKSYLISKIPDIVDHATADAEDHASRATTPLASAAASAATSAATSRSVSAGEWQGGKTRRQKKKHTRRKRLFTS